MIAGRRPGRRAIPPAGPGDPYAAGVSSLGTSMPVLRPVPRDSLRPWAGTRLGGVVGQVGERWLAGPDSVVDAGGWGTLTLDELAAAAGESLVGRRGMALLGPRFPLLVKVIDAGAWLSLQVHPSDELAAELYGSGALGKAEAWVVLDAAPGSSLITGPRPSLPADALRRAIRAGTVGRDHCDERPATPGDVLLLEPGTLHAIGAGAFVYEIEQPSDLTFRVSDWGRPATPGRGLHVPEALRAIRPDAHARPVGRDWRLDGGALAVPQFALEIAAAGEGLTRMPAGESPEVLTVVRGRAVVSGDGWREPLDTYGTLVVPASVPRYRIEGSEEGLVCIGTLPPT